ncbi:hypothetical protein [Cellulomonas aerilata]|nr:hypothetical protein [Cellulomonas aerilata]
MSDIVRDPTDELVVFAVPQEAMQLRPDLRDDYCYWPMVSTIAAQSPLPLLGPVHEPTYQYMTRPDDLHGIELRHPCARCRASVERAAQALAGVEPGTLGICVAQCVVVYLRDIQTLDGRFSPIMRLADTV